MKDRAELMRKRSVQISNHQHDKIRQLKAQVIWLRNRVAELEEESAKATEIEDTKNPA